MSGRALSVLQSRLSSSRLPAKALLRQFAQPPGVIIHLHSSGLDALFAAELTRVLRLFGSRSGEGT
jgi:hypothetical protein